MAPRASSSTAAQRVPLGDASSRANIMAAAAAPAAAPAADYLCHAHQRDPSQSSSRAGVGPVAKAPGPVQQQAPTGRESSTVSSTAALPRAPAVSRDGSSPVAADGGPPQPSNAPSASARTSVRDGVAKLKTHIGPWQLGRTLGKGSSARVRAARHRVTHEPVAVKIVAKRTAHMTQAGSLARLDKIDSVLPDNVDGVRRMPLALEREVAILKLIEHPNIVKLYDIWENREEIYLILEFVERGDLFEYINQHGPMTEEQAMFVFRQMMSAIEYCHSYNICHRDLKPENILLKSDGMVKIADFGMAALHQGPSFELRTACGSPHYAAPELLKSLLYRGDKADIWSMGVILFAMLAARLPFDDDRLQMMLAKAKRGIYEMPQSFSKDAQDLIGRILQVDPAVRISMSEMWRHPLVWKYGYMDDLGSNDGQPPDVRIGKQLTPLGLTNIDSQVFRQLRSMWHTLTEHDLAIKLVTIEPNDQKLFYWLLYNYRERQLENFNPSLTHSASDYHLLKPTNWTRKVSTRQFSQPKADGHGRSVSRFTVISHVAEPDDAEVDTGTERSYDPYKSSLVMRPGTAQASRARIVIHRSGLGGAVDGAVDDQRPSAVGSMSSRASSVPGGPGPGARKRLRSLQGGTSGRLQSPRSSSSSIRSSGRPSTLRMRANSRHKRNVDFSSIRKKYSDGCHHAGLSTTAVHGSSSSSRPMPAGVPSDVASDSRHPLSSPFQSLSRRSDGVGDEAQTLPVRDPKAARSRRVTDISSSFPFNEELRQLSSSIAKDCDEAFSGSLLSMDSLDPDGEALARARGSSPLSLTLGTPQLSPPAVARPWDSRPLPPTPSLSESVHLELMQAQAAAREQRHHHHAAVYGGPYDTPMPSRIENMPLHLRSQSVAVAGTPAAADRRSVSAPLHAQLGRGARPLPSIYEATAAEKRIVSAPAKAPAPPPSASRETRGLNFLSRAEKTIRVVNSPNGVAFQPSTASAAGAAGAVETPRPLKLRKKSITGLQGWDQSASGGLLVPLVEQDAGTGTDGSSTAVPPKKKLSWFRRSSSKTEAQDTGAAPASAQQLSHHVHEPKPPLADPGHPRRTRSESTDTAPPPVPPAKKKGVLLQFWKLNLKKDPKLSLAGPEFEDSESHERANGPYNKKRSDKRVVSGKSWNYDSDSSQRKIEPQQSWLARLFRVKPATSYMCLAISRRRARQEVAILLREWRKYGITDIEVDKERNIVFARVGGYNYLGMKEVSLACEIMTVIEHGKRTHLSIVRFTQEKGAASSFYRVVDTMKGVFNNRNLTVVDKHKAKMMIKTLNS